MINPTIFREPDGFKRVYERLIAWQPVFGAGYSPPWSAKQILRGDEINNAIKQRKEAYLEAMSEMVTLLQIPEYAEAVKHVQDYNLGGKAFREALGAKEKYEAAEATIEFIENDHESTQDR